MVYNIVSSFVPSPITAIFWARDLKFSPKMQIVFLSKGKNAKKCKFVFLSKGKNAKIQIFFLSKCKKCKNARNVNCRGKNLEKYECKSFWLDTQSLDFARALVWILFRQKSLIKYYCLIQAN